MILIVHSLQFTKQSDYATECSTMSEQNSDEMVHYYCTRAAKPMQPFVGLMINTHLYCNILSFFIQPAYSAGFIQKEN